MTTTTTHPPARLALVGDRSPTVGSHRRIPQLLSALAERDRLLLDAYWIPTRDAVWLLPGSPYESERGALNAVRTARERGIPFLGTCAGFLPQALGGLGGAPKPCWSSRATSAG
jgi:CTP synthase (UTP-ammonia lyase)